jgi:very-short-patch-repair endonuclease
VGGVSERNQDPPRDGEGDRAKRGGGGSPPSLRRPEVYAARRQRCDLSLPEALLWRELKGQPGGIRFRKQHPIRPYFADFYCAAAKLVIEVDGIAHDMGYRPSRDVERDRYLAAKGYHVLRIPASEVLADPGATAEAIVRAAGPLRQSLRDCHLPMNGENL